MIPEGKTRVMLTLDDELLEKMDCWCDENGMTKSGFVTYLAEVAFSADSTAADLLRQTFVRQAVKLAADREIMARLKELDGLYNLVGIA